MKKIYRFTLVEILAVMALISILSAIGFGVYSYAKGKAKESATEALLGQIAAGLESFNAKHHYYPSSKTTGTGADKTSLFSTIQFSFNADGTVTEIDFGGTGGKLTYNSSASSKKERMENELIESFTKAVDMQTIKNNLDKDGCLVDAWGTKIYYRSPGKFKTGSYDLISAGADGVFSNSNEKKTEPESNTSESGGKLTDFRDNAGEKVCDDLFNF